MDDYLLILSPQEFQQQYQEVELKLEKLHNKNNVIQQNLDLDIIKQDLYKMIKQEMDALQTFIQDIKDQMNILEKNANSIDAKNKLKRLKDIYLKETQRNKAIFRILNNKSSFQSEKSNDEISILSKSDTGGHPDLIEPIPVKLDYKESNVQNSNLSDDVDQGRIKPSKSSIQEEVKDDEKKSQLFEPYIQQPYVQQNQQQEEEQEQQQEIEIEEDPQEEINNYIYFIILVIVVIIAGLIIWLLYDENIL